jgi:hypothetical protein
MSRLRIIRGDKFVKALIHLEETTYAELEQGTIKGFPRTTKRQHATDPVRVVQLQLVPFTKTNDLKVTTVINSSGKKYDNTILFKDVVYEDSDQDDNVTFTASDGEEYNIEPIPLSGSEIQVTCNCLDFRWRFSLWNADDKSLYGKNPPPYRKKTNRPPNNPDQTPGVCKHLIKSIEALKQAHLVEL